MLALDFPVPRGLLLYDYWFVFSFSQLRGTHILEGGERKSRNYHYSLTTYPVPRAKFGASLAMHSINTYCAMYWALRTEPRTSLVVKKKHLKIIPMTIHMP